MEEALAVQGGQEALDDTQLVLRDGLRAAQVARRTVQVRKQSGQKGVGSRAGHREVEYAGCRRRGRSKGRVRSVVFLQGGCAKLAHRTTMR